MIKPDLKASKKSLFLKIFIAVHVIVVSFYLGQLFQNYKNLSTNNLLQSQVDNLSSPKYQEALCKLNANYGIDIYVPAVTTIIKNKTGAMNNEESCSKLVSRPAFRLWYDKCVTPKCYVQDPEENARFIGILYSDSESPEPR